MVELEPLDLTPEAFNGPLLHLALNHNGWWKRSNCFYLPRIFELDSLEDMEKPCLPWLQYSPEVYIPFMEVWFHQFSDLQGSTMKQYTLKSGSHLADIWSLRIPAFGF